MGYTHYLYRPKEMDEDKFKDLSKDVKKILDYVQQELDIKLSNGMAELGNEPKVDGSVISFNGSEQQPVGLWTTTQDVSIVYPKSSPSLQQAISDPTAERPSGDSYGGYPLRHRIAPIADNEFGSGSYETMYIERVMKPNDWNDPENGLYFSCCKTAYRPYDIAVTAVLIATKYHFPEVIVSSDGLERDWIDGRIVCFNLFGYGMDVDIEL